MKKVYCVYCGEKNRGNDKKCIKCGKEINPKNHPWRDYLYEHIKDDLKGKVTDNIFSLIRNFIKSHLYGVILSTLVVTTVTVGIVKVVNDSYIKDVTEKPKISIKTEELSIDSDLVVKLYAYNNYNQDVYLEAVKENDDFKTDFYEDTLVNYDNLSDQSKMYAAYNNTDLKIKETSFKSCDELKGYDYVYNLCLREPGYAIGDDYYDSAFSYYTIDNEAFNNKYKEMFGSNKEIPFGRYRIAPTRACEHSKDKDDYLCYALPEGWFNTTYEKTKLVKALKVGNTVILYDYFLYVGRGEVFKDKNITVKIADEYNDNLLEQGQLYKHTYKKDINGNYYWFSSEPVDTF